MGNAATGFEYNPTFQIYHQFGTIGAFVLGFSFFIMFYNLAKSYVPPPKPVTTRGLLADRRVGGPVAAAA